MSYGALAFAPTYDELWADEIDQEGAAVLALVESQFSYESSSDDDALDVDPDETANDDAARFELLADELSEAAAGLSSTRAAASHPAFAEIIALGDEALPQAMERLKSSENRPLWLRVVGTIAASPPSAGRDTIDEAAGAWLDWARASGRLA